jgi:hypothetical protein
MFSQTSATLDIAIIDENTHTHTHTQEYINTELEKSKRNLEESMEKHFFQRRIDNQMIEKRVTEHERNEHYNEYAKTTR